MQLCSPLVRTLLSALAVSVSVSESSAQSWDLSADFSGAENPNGAWAFGYSDPTTAFAAPAGFVEFPNVQDYLGNPDLPTWFDAALPFFPPALFKNLASQPVQAQAGLIVPAQSVFFHPGPQNQHGVVKWTAPVGGLYRLKARFETIGAQATGVDVHILHEQNELFTEPLLSFGDSTSFSSDVSMAAGEGLLATVGFGAGAFNSDSTVVELNITRVLGASYCGPSVANSSGAGAIIEALGDDSVAANSLTLECSQMPLNTFGYFLSSRNVGNVPMAGGSQGTLCLSGMVGRHDAQIENSGSVARICIAVDLTAMPTPAGQISAAIGETWRFQCWFRDANPSTTSNFSDGVEVTLQ